jgi:site-specific DNA-cytosine methylase
MVSKPAASNPLSNPPAPVNKDTIFIGVKTAYWAPRHKDALENIKSLFTESNYNLSFLLLNAVDYGVPQDRKRVFFIGIRNDLNFSFHLLPFVFCFSCAGSTESWISEIQSCNVNLFANDFGNLKLMMN